MPLFSFNPSNAPLYVSLLSFKCIASFNTFIYMYILKCNPLSMYNVIYMYF